MRASRGASFETLARPGPGPAGRRFSLRLLLGSLAGALLMLPAGVSRAQGEAPSGLEEIERGVYVQAVVGSKIFLLSPAHDGAETPRIRGATMGIAAGYDVLDVLQIEGFVTGGQIRAPASYGGLGGPLDPHGDFSSFLAGVKVRFSALTMADGQGVERIHLTAHGGGGFLTTLPSTVVETGRPTALGGAGLYYYTRLRHFAVGFELDAFYGLGANAFALFPQARLSYTF